MINVIYYPIPAQLNANQTFTGTNTFTGATIFTGPATFADIVVGTPTGGNEGPGTINVSGGFFVNGVAIGTPGVTSVFGRLGAVIAQTGDYNVSQITGAAPLASPTFAGEVRAKDFEAVLYVDSLNSQGWAGIDVGAWINSAYAALPAIGGRIKVAALETGGNYTFSTAILFGVNGKYVYLEGDGQATILTCTGAATAITIDTGAGHQPSGMFGILLSGPGGTSTGVSLGSTNSSPGAEQFQFHLCKIQGFGTQVSFTSSFSFMVNFNKCVIGPGAGFVGISVPSSVEIENASFDNCLIFQLATGVNIAGQGEFDFNDCDFDDNTTVALNIPSNGATLTFNGCHFENAGLGTSQYITVTGLNTNVVMFGGDVTEDRTGGTQPQFISVGGSGCSIVMDGVAVGSAGATVTEVVTLSGNANAQLWIINTATPTTTPAQYNTAYTNGRVIDWPLRSDSAIVTANIYGYSLHLINGNLEVGGDVGFYGTSPITKPTATGSKSGNAALASLMTALANLGLVTDSTT